MDVTELNDEENLLVQMQDRWENYGSLDGIADTHDPFDLAGAPRFELYEKLNSLLNHALTADENLLLRQTLGMGCKQRSIKDLAQQMGTTQKAVQKQLASMDTLTASRRQFGQSLPNHQLHTVAAACGYDLQKHHHALADAEACAAIALYLL